MNQLKTIIVGVDFSERSAVALSQAVYMAQWHKAKLHVVHVIDALVLDDLQKALERQGNKTSVFNEVYTAAQERVQQLLDQTSTAGADLDIKIEIRTGQPLAEMLRRVRATAADLLVLGSNSSSQPEQGAGALATNCVRKAPTKVMLVRKRHTAAFTRVVACVDFSETSRLAVEQAIRVAKQDGARLDIVHVYAPPWQALHYMRPTTEASPKFQQQYKLNLQGCLDQFIKPFADDLAGLTVERHLIGSTQRPADAIVDFLKTREADLAVLGTRGRSGLLAWFMGSIAERIVRESPCSVLAIKPEGFQFDID